LTGVGEHGTGTVVRLANGRYRIAVTMADGRRIWRRARGPREAERVRLQLVEMRELDLDPSRQTLGAWLRSWIESLRDAKRQRLAPRTLDHYAMIVERHIVPALGHLPLTQVSERKIQAWLDGSEGSPRTIAHHRAVLRLGLNRAVRQRLLVRNPAAGRSIELPDATWHGQKPLTLDEARRLLATSADSRWHALWRTALVTGLRQGELLGLTWDDLQGPSLTVTGQMQRRGKAWVRGATKSARALSRIALDPATVAVLERHRIRMGEERTDDWRYFGHVFVTPKGEPPWPSEILYAFHAACDAAGIARRRFHDLRGSTATIMRDLGVPEDARMARLGHETTDMARHYGRASESRDRDAVERLGEAIG